MKFWVDELFGGSRKDSTLPNKYPIRIMNKFALMEIRDAGI